MVHHLYVLARETWTVLATPQGVSGLRRDAVAFAKRHDVSEPPIADLTLALSEALSNAVVHAFHPGRPGTVSVRLSVDWEHALVRVWVFDDGHGMRPRMDSPGIGLGMPLMATLAEEFDVRSAPGGSGTEVEMMFRLDTPATLH